MSTTRRSLLAGLAALPLAPRTGLTAPQADAALLALAPAVEATIATVRAAYNRHNAAEALHFAEQPSPDYSAAEDAVTAAEGGWCMLHDKFVDMPARTVAGLQVKVRVCNGDPEMDPQMMASIAADIMAMKASA